MQAASIEFDFVFGGVKVMNAAAACNRGGGRPLPAACCREFFTFTPFAAACIVYFGLRHFVRLLAEVANGLKTWYYFSVDTDQRFRCN